MDVRWSERKEIFQIVFVRNKGEREIGGFENFIDFSMITEKQ